MFNKNIIFTNVVDSIHVASTASTGADDQTIGHRSAALLLDSLHPSELRGIICCIVGL